MYKIGDYNELSVKRKTDLGYVLTNSDNDEIFMHQNDCSDNDLLINDIVYCFLFFDNKKRLCATNKKVFATTTQLGLLEVKQVNAGLGVFLDNNTTKDILLSEKFLPTKQICWPNHGGKLLVYLLATPTNISARIVSKAKYDEYLDNTNLLNLLSDNVITKGSSYDGYVYNHVGGGIVVATMINGQILSVYIYNSLYRIKPALGELVNYRITEINIEEKSILAAINPQKEMLIEDDSKIIYEYLLNNNKEMSFNNASDPADILSVFNMSKKAYKRALGSLYKKRLIDFKNEKTILIALKDEV